MQTAPDCIKDDVVTYNSNKDGLAGLLVPLSPRKAQMRCKLQVAVDGNAQFQTIKQLIQQQPQATEKGRYHLDISVYDRLEGEICSFMDGYSVDALLAIVATTGAGAVNVQWDVKN